MSGDCLFTTLLTRQEKVRKDVNTVQTIGRDRLVDRHTERTARVQSRMVSPPESREAQGQWLAAVARLEHVAQLLHTQGLASTAQDLSLQDRTVPKRTGQHRAR